MLPGFDATPLRREFKKLMLRAFAVFTAVEKALLRLQIGAASSGLNNDLVSINGSPVAFGNAWQTVISGPVDSSGRSSFGGATGASSVTAAGTIITSAANGFAAGGQVNYIASSANPAFTGLTTNGTMYLYEDTNATTLVKTQGTGTLAPSYIAGGTPSITNGQFTFDYTKRIGYVGNGATAVQTNRVYLGEVTVAANVVSAIVWYALNGRYILTTATLPAPAAAISQNHNIGIADVRKRLILTNITAQNGFVTGETIEDYFQWDGASVVFAVGKWSGRLAGGFTLLAGYALYTFTKSTGAITATTAANWSYTLEFTRSWGGS